MDNALVSIIVPVYNVAEYLDECMASIVSQTYRNIEIILVDDGSADDSGEKCDGWKDSDTRISVYHIENSGPSAARNFGLDAAKGDYVYFCDSDDKPEATLLEKAMAVLNSDDDVDMLAFGYRVLSTGNSYSDMVMKDAEYDMSTDSKRLSTIVGPFAKHYLGWNLWNRIFKKKIIEENHLSLDPDFRIGEDKLFCLMYLSHCRKVVTIHECLYNYVRRDNSLMGENRKNNVIDISRCTNMAKSLYAHYENNTDCAYLLSNFHLIFYPFIESTVKSYGSICSDFKKLREIFINDLNDHSDTRFFFDMVSGFDTDSFAVRENYSNRQRFEKKVYVKWLKTGRTLPVRLVSAARKMRNNAGK